MDGSTQQQDKSPLIELPLDEIPDPETNDEAVSVQTEQEQSSITLPPELQAWLDAGNTDVNAYYAAKYAAQPPTPAPVQPASPASDPHQTRIKELQDVLKTTRANIVRLQSTGMDSDEARSLLQELQDQELQTNTAIGYEAGMQAARQVQATTQVRQQVGGLLDHELNQMLLADFGVNAKAIGTFESIPFASDDLAMTLQRQPDVRAMLAKSIAYDMMKAAQKSPARAPATPVGQVPNRQQQRQQAPMQITPDFMVSGFRKDVK